MRLLSPDVKGQIDGSVKSRLLDYLPDLPIDILVVSWFPDFQFVPPQTDKFVMFDFLEPHAPNPAYDQFSEWLSQNPPLLTFKRELRASEASETVLPIEWPVYVDIPPVQSKEEFDKRPISVFFSWGFSNLSRPRLQSDIWKGMAEDGIDVISQFDQLAGHPHNPNQQLWAAIYTPHWNRRPISEIIQFQQQARISVSLHGNGRKCFRDTEACVGSIMALQCDDTVYSFPWTNQNAILLEPGFDYLDLEAAINGRDLYDLYYKGQMNAIKYTPHYYVNEYIVPNIQKVL